MSKLETVVASNLVTSESVSYGHPDKIADQISDVLLDLHLQMNPEARTAIETLVTANNVILAGEISGASADTDNIETAVRQTLQEIGCIDSNFHWQKVKITNLLHQQSVDIACGVDPIFNGIEGAGDQGVMYGYATNETAVLMPAPIYYAHLILKNIMSDLNCRNVANLGPDAKAQVTLLYENGAPKCATNVLVSIQHPNELSQLQVREIIYPIVCSSLPKGWMCSDEKFLVNPTGRFVIGGPVGDCGLTGRKIMVDTYGGHIPHGGGAFSGKDATKVDRSAAYMARYLAKNIVSSGLADRCLTQLSYAIGVPQPLSFSVNTFGTSNVAESAIAKLIWDNIDLSPRGIRTALSLHKPIYRSTACYGHFGRNVAGEMFPWEATNLAARLQMEFGNDIAERRAVCYLRNEA